MQKQKLKISHFPSSPEEVAYKLMEKILMAERKSSAPGDSAPKPRSRREEALGLYADCIAVVRGRQSATPS
ncbi:hypothetical protein [Roseomonas chloroacetimidivorans]|jgi:hypothetical protein|uniref:hypothetical protein n=1 Tax=Roseomonas chloroacetimidivorans TaxID=1766656 RepID=UPI003C7656FE